MFVLLLALALIASAHAAAQFQLFQGACVRARPHTHRVERAPRFVAHLQRAKPDAAGEYRFRLLANNHEIILAR